MKPEENKLPEITLVDADELKEDTDDTEPSASPPKLPGILIGPPPRPVATSLPSQFELESERKSSPPVLERRKQLTKLVASAVGVAWFICIVAMGQTMLRTFILH